MSNGAIIENLSNRKLCYISFLLLTALVGFFFIGAVYAPVPSSSMEFEMVKCKDKYRGSSQEWFYIRPPHCDLIEDLSSFEPQQHSFDLRDIVFVAQMPHARDGRQLEYSPWFNFLLGLLQVDIEYHEAFKYKPDAKILLEVRMGYRNRADPPDSWQEYLATNVTRALECTISSDKKSSGNLYDCGVLDLFELGSNSFPFYLLNIRLPINVKACEKDALAPNCAIGMINALRVIAIHQNGGFTRVFLALKTILFPLVLAAIYWYRRRLNGLPRKKLLLERAILVLAIALAALDLPIEWLSLTMRLPFLLLLSDIRQGLFYAVLFSFWLVFAGEHLIDDTTRNNLTSYWRNLSVIGLASLALLIYDLAERGMQLADPFYSIWSSEVGTNIAYASIYTAAVCTIGYFVFLFYKIGLVWVTIRRKRAAQLYAACERRRIKVYLTGLEMYISTKKYVLRVIIFFGVMDTACVKARNKIRFEVEAIIWRFKFLMLCTLISCAFTIVAYFMRQFGEASLHGESPEDSVMTGSISAFFTGTFGMWNIYVLLLLAMYAPSHKQYSGAQGLTDENDDLLFDAGAGISGEQRTESNPLTTFLKSAQD